MVTKETTEEFLKEIPVTHLPGCGEATTEKLNNNKIYTCGDMLSLSKQSLQKILGNKSGKLLLLLLFILY